MKSGLIGAILTVLVSFGGNAQAAPPPSLKSLPGKDVVIVPYDGSKPLKEQKPDQVYVPYARFLELWEAAKAARSPARTPDAPRSFALSSARYDAQVEDGRVTIKATLELTTYNQPWVSVPIPFDAVVSTLTLDGKAVSLAEGKLLVEQPGRHTLVAEMEKELPEEAMEFAWAVPKSAATRLHLTLPDARWTASVWPEAGVVEETKDGKRIVTAALGETEEIKVQLKETTGPARAIDQPASATFHHMVTVHPTFERIVSQMTFSHPGAERDRYTIQAPQGLNLVEINLPGLRSWKLAAAGDRQELEVILTSPVRDETALSVVWERPRQLPAKGAAPIFASPVRRLEQAVLLAAHDDVKVVAEPAAGWRQIEPAQVKGGEAISKESHLTVVGAWAGSGALNYEASAAPLRHEAQIHSVYQVNRRKVELISSLQLRARGGALFETTVSIPPGFDVLVVNSQRLQDWWQDGAQLRVRFRGETPEVTPLVIHLVKQYSTAPQSLEIQPLGLPGFAKVNGEAVIAAHKGVDTSLQFEAGGDANEVDAAKAATDFQVLPPMERKRGFTFKGQKFSGKVALTLLPAKVDAAWILHAEAHEVWVSLSLKAQLNVRQGSIEVTVFSLPASLPEARVSGPEIREARSKVVGDRRVYEVQFQDDVYQAVDFTVDLDAPLAGQFSLPTPEFPAAQMVTGYLVADNASEYEMQLRPEGVVPVRVEELPWQPVVTKSAGVFRAPAGWKLTLIVEKLEKTEARSAYCAWAEMTTSLRRDGTEWHKAVWRLQNRSLQFLPVALPPGAELMSARVAGQGVRADTGVVAGRTATLVPLIRTKPGDVSYDVEVVWRKLGTSLVTGGKRKFDDAELIGITVEQTFWNVWVPNEQPLTGVDGNMTEVIEVARDVEKGRAALQELKSLNKLLSSEQLDVTTWGAAQRNFDLNCTDLNDRVIGNAAKLSEATSSFENAPQSRTQIQNRVSELMMANGQVDQELKQAVDDNRRLQAFNTRRFAGARPNQPPASQPTPQAQTISGPNNAPQGLPQLSESLSAQQLPAQQQQRFQSLEGQSMQAPLGNQAAQIYNEGNLDRSARWNVNANASVSSAKKPASKPSEPSGKTDHFYLNDNIVLKEEAKSAASGGMVDGEKAGKMVVVKGDAAAASVPTPQPPAKREENRQVSRYSRALKSEDTLSRTPGAAPMAGNAVTTNYGVINLDVNTAPQALAFSTAQPQAAFPPALNTAGRVALVVDFPTEGHVHHFQKVKASAELELGIGREPVRMNWPLAGIFGVLALVLAVAPRVVRTRFFPRRLAAR